MVNMAPLDSQVYRKKDSVLERIQCQNGLLLPTSGSWGLSRSHELNIFSQERCACKGSCPDKNQKGKEKRQIRGPRTLKERNDSGQTYSTDISGHRQIRLLPLKENGITSPHTNLYENASKASHYHRRHLVVDGTSSSTAPRRRRTLAMGSYILGWLRLTDVVWLSSRPFLYLIIPLRFRFRPAST